MLFTKTVLELRELIRKKEVKPSEVLESFIERKEAVESKINAYTQDLYEIALKQAKELDEKSPSGELFGIPIAIKDNINVKGYKTTCSSKMLENYISVYDATVIEKLKKEGAIIVGKTNMDEFAMGSSTEYSAFFKTKNPWDLERVPGGSSGGSAAAVSSLMVPLSLGSDTGGSIRQPASFCGTVGIKPTYGRVSRYGLVAFASSLDQIGPFARNSLDAALLLKVISGFDQKDSTCAPIEVPDFVEEAKKEIKNLKVGIIKEFNEDGIEKDVRESFESFIKFLEKSGFEIKELSIPSIKYSLPTYYIIAPAEASSNLARFDGVRYGYRASDYNDLFEFYAKTRDEGFGPEVKRRIMLGTHVLSSGYYDAYYGKALKVKALIKREFLNALKEVDILVSPTSPTTAFKFGEKLSDPVSMYLSDIFTVSINLATVPALSLLGGFSKDNLPIGIQLIGKPFDEITLLRVANYFESSHDFTKKIPLL